MFAGRNRAARLRAARGLVLCVLVSLLAVPATAAAAPQYRGVQLHSLWPESTSADMDRELDLSRQAGANAVRVDVGWGSIEEAGPGRYNSWYVDRLDRFVAGADARGMKVIAGVWGTPCWASTAPDSAKQGCAQGWWGRGVAAYPPANPADYGSIARWLTARYGTRLAALEVWNEPNLQSSIFWKTTDKAGAYASLLKAAYPAAKAGNPNVPVLAGALSGSDQAFLSALYAHGIRGSYDGVSVHPYADQGFTKLALFRSVQRAAGDTSPVWATEFGWPTGTGGEWHVPEAEQAANIRQGFADLSRLDYVQGATLYNLRDKGTNAFDPEDNFGLVRRDYSPKPGYAALREALAGSGAPAAASASVSPATRPTVNVRLRVLNQRGTSIANGSAPPRRLIRLRLARCARTSRVWTVRAKRNGRFKRRLGRARRLRGCRVFASLA